MHALCLACLPVIATALLHASFASARPADAEVLFDQGRSLMAEHHYDDAAHELERSEALDPGAGTLIELAECYVKLGRTASAWSTYRTAASLASNSHEASREAFARKRADELNPKLITLAITVPAEIRVPGLNVTRGGVAVPDALWGEPVPVDPGSLDVVVSAPGRISWTRSVVLDETTPVVAVTVPPLEVEPAAAPAAPPPAALPAAPPRIVPVEVPPPRKPTTNGTTQRIVGWSVGGAGVVTAAIGLVLYAHSHGTIRDANCPDRRCVEGIGNLALFDDGRRQEQRAVAIMGLGAGIAAAGVVVVLTAPSSATTRAVALALGPTEGGAVFGFSGDY